MVTLIQIFSTFVFALLQRKPDKASTFYEGPNLAIGFWFKFNQKHIYFWFNVLKCTTVFQLSNKMIFVFYKNVRFCNVKTEDYDKGG